MTEIEIAEKIKNAGGTLFLVGGAVRDHIMGKTIHDKDYCVVGITAKEFQELFPNSFIKGKSFEVFELENNEYAMARTERKIGIGHKEFNILTGKNISIEEDLARRDLTINAIAQNVLTQEIVDPFKGIEDIKNRKLRATTINFKEDPLRVYRVARFASTLGFEVENETLKLMNLLKDELKTLSRERVFTEFSKALSSEKPSIFFEVLKDAQVLEIHFKEIHDLMGVKQPIEFHPEGDAYNHTMRVLDYASKQTNDLVIRFSALVHDLGKGLTPKEEYPHHYNHEIKGVELVEKLSKRICVPISWKKSGKVACREHMRGGIFNKMKPSKKVDFIERIAKSQLGLEGLQIVVNADKLSSSSVDKNNINFEKIGKMCINEINGRYIKEKFNISEGIAFGNKLREERIKWMKEKETRKI